MIGRCLVVLGTVLVLAAVVEAQVSPESCPIWPEGKKVAMVAFLNDSLERVRFYHAWGYPSISHGRQAVCTVAPNTYCVAFVDATKLHVFSFHNGLYHESRDLYDLMYGWPPGADLCKAPVF